ncbi:response regulator, partial [candidate division KSB3 bacterium]|nr:response regulator [candidate division KSB3 bacterium]MBD3327178.1 response regulator [candidate division KSB3 bacterium]
MPMIPTNAPLEASILIVDDTPANLSILFDYLNQKGFRVLIAQSGQSALEQIAYDQPDIIL